MGISTRTYGDKSTYLWRQVHVLLSIGCSFAYFHINFIAVREISAEPKVDEVKARKTTDGGETPGNSATAKEVPKGRQRHKQFDINKLCVLSPILGLVLLMHLSRGLAPPSVISRPFGTFGKPL